jgi:phage tail-like protein
VASDLVRTFNFRVTLTRSATGEAGQTPAGPRDPNAQRLADGAFQECSGLDLELDVQELEEGGRNDGVIRRVGRMKLAPIVLKRGMLHEDGTTQGDLWRWIQDVGRGIRPARRYDGLVEVLAPAAGDVVATWSWDRGLPAKVAGPRLDAKTGDVAIEELHIAHEGLRLVVP